MGGNVDAGPSGSGSPVRPAEVAARPESREITRPGQRCATRPTTSRSPASARGARRSRSCTARLRDGADPEGAAAGGAAARSETDRRRQPAGGKGGFRQHHLPPLRRPGQAGDGHAGLPLRRAVAVDPGVRARLRARALAGGDPRARGPARVAALRAAGGGQRQRQLHVRPAHHHEGAARHRPARVPRRRRAVRGGADARDGDSRRAQDEQAPRQRRGPRRAGGVLRRRHGADGGAVGGAAAEVAELERQRGAVLPALPAQPVAVLAGALRSAGGGLGGARPAPHRAPAQAP